MRDDLGSETEVLAGTLGKTDNRPAPQQETSISGRILLNGAIDFNDEFAKTIIGLVFTLLGASGSWFLVPGMRHEMIDRVGDTTRHYSNGVELLSTYALTSTNFGQVVNGHRSLVGAARRDAFALPIQRPAVGGGAPTLPSIADGGQSAPPVLPYPPCPHGGPTTRPESWNEEAQSTRTWAGLLRG